MVETEDGPVEIKVGQVWRTREGGVDVVVDVVGYAPPKASYPCKLRSGETCTPQGLSINGYERSGDLTRLIADAVETDNGDGTVTRVMTLPVRIHKEVDAEFVIHKFFVDSCAFGRRVIGAVIVDVTPREKTPTGYMRQLLDAGWEAPSGPDANWMACNSEGPKLFHGKPVWSDTTQAHHDIYFGQAFPPASYFASLTPPAPAEGIDPKDTLIDLNEYRRLAADWGQGE